MGTLRRLFLLPRDPTAEEEVHQGGHAPHGFQEDLGEFGEAVVVRRRCVGLLKSRLTGDPVGVRYLDGVAQRVQHAKPALHQCVSRKLADYPTEAAVLFRQTGRQVAQVLGRVQVSDDVVRQRVHELVPALDHAAIVPPSGAEVSERLPEVWRGKAVDARLQPRLEEDVDQRLREQPPEAVGITGGRENQVSGV